VCVCVHAHTCLYVCVIVVRIFVPKHTCMLVFADNSSQNACVCVCLCEEKRERERERERERDREREREREREKREWVCVCVRKLDIGNHSATHLSLKIAGQDEQAAPAGAGAAMCQFVSMCVFLCVHACLCM